MVQLIENTHPNIVRSFVMVNNSAFVVLIKWLMRQCDNSKQEKKVCEIFLKAGSLGVNIVV